MMYKEQLSTDARCCSSPLSVMGPFVSATGWQLGVLIPSACLGNATESVFGCQASQALRSPECGDG